MNRRALIGQRVRIIRRKLRLSQKQFAQELGLSPGAVSTYELGDNYPTIDTLAKIARLGGTTFNWLVMGDSFKQSDETVISETESYLLERFREADEEGRELIIRIAEMTAQGKKKRRKGEG